ncbi:MAG: sugar nucleotide-binding protein, partial [Anaerolineales bacterium]
EVAVAEALPSSLIVRTNFYGWNVQPKLSLAEWFLQRLRTGLPCPGFVDVTAAPLLANDLARILIGMVERACAGVYHVVSRECVSKFEFGRRVASTFGLDPGRIQPVQVEEAGLRARRAKQLCLRVDKLEAELGRRLPDIQDGLARFRALGESGFAERFAHAP